MAFLLLVLIIPSGPAMSSEEIEETAETTLSRDDTLIGKMTDYSTRAIYVNDLSYYFCRNPRIFSPRNKVISLDNIDTAKEVKLFINNGCVRKVHVLRFGS
jgi:hypothetical protein